SSTGDAGARSTVSSDAPRVFAEVGSEPTISIGGADAVGPAQLYGVVGVHMDGAGRIWVADAQSAELRIFGSDGSHWKTRGGRGEGPREFTNIQLLGAIAGDSVMTSNGADGRVTLFDPEGELAYTERVSGNGGLMPFFQDVFADGALLARVPRILRAARLAPGQVLTDSVELVRVDRATSSVEPAAAAGGPLWIWTGQTQAPIPFTARAAVDVVGNEVHVASGPEFHVQVFRDGMLRETYGVDRAPRPVRASDIDAYRSFVEAYVPEELRADHLAAMEHDL